MCRGCDSIEGRGSVGLLSGGRGRSVAPDPLARPVHDGRNSHDGREPGQAESAIPLRQKRHGGYRGPGPSGKYFVSGHSDIDASGFSRSSDRPITAAAIGVVRLGWAFRYSAAARSPSMLSPMRAAEALTVSRARWA